MTMTAVGYCRVSTEQQGETGYGLGAQESEIRTEAARRGWELSNIHVDVASGGSRRRRSSLVEALEALRSGEAQVLIVSKLDRLSRSLADFADITATSRREGWSIVALDINVDTSTINGELIANIIMALAQWERRIIGKRTSDALAIARDRGVRLGRPRNVDEGTLALIRTLRNAGKGYHTISRILNENAVPTAQHGKAWYPATVQLIHERDDVEPDPAQDALPIEGQPAKQSS